MSHQQAQGKQEVGQNLPETYSKTSSSPDELEMDEGTTLLEHQQLTSSDKAA